MLQPPPFSALHGINLVLLCNLLACIPWEVALVVGLDNILNERQGYVAHITNIFYIAEAKYHSFFKT